MAPGKSPVSIPPSASRRSCLTARPCSKPRFERTQPSALIRDSALGCSSGLRKRGFAIFEALPNLGDRIHARLSVLVLNIGGNRVFLRFQKLKHSFDVRFALPEWQIVALLAVMIRRAVFQMERDNLVMVLLRNCTGSKPAAVKWPISR